MKINKCPFCGSNARLQRRQMQFIRQYEDGQKEIKMSVYVVCNKCHSRGMPITYRKIGMYRHEFEDELFDEMAIESWNKRNSEVKEMTEIKKEPFWKTNKITKIGTYVLKTENEYVLAHFDGKGLDIDSEMTGQHILAWHKIEG